MDGRGKVGVGKRRLKGRERVGRREREDKGRGQKRKGAK